MLCWTVIAVHYIDASTCASFFLVFLLLLCSSNTSGNLIIIAQGIIRKFLPVLTTRFPEHISPSPSPITQRLTLPPASWQPGRTFAVMKSVHLFWLWTAITCSLLWNWGFLYIRSYHPEAKQRSRPTFSVLSFTGWFVQDSHEILRTYENGGTSLPPIFNAWVVLISLCTHSKSAALGVQMVCCVNE